MFIACVYDAEKPSVPGSQTASVSSISQQDSHQSAISSSKQSSSAAVSDNASGSRVRLLLLSHNICTLIDCPTKHIIGHSGDGALQGQMTQPTVSKHYRKIDPKY